MELIPKIGLVLLQARIPAASWRLGSPPNDALGSAQRRERRVLDEDEARAKLDLWRNGSPLRIDVSRTSGAAATDTAAAAAAAAPSSGMSNDGVSHHGSSSRLLERWTLSFEPSTADGQLDDTAETDRTDLVLLVQSLYAYLRSMPLDQQLRSGNMSKELLQYSITTPDEWGSMTSPSFPPQQMSAHWVGSHVFRPAETSFGVVQLSVLYWRFQTAPTLVRKTITPVASQEYFDRKIGEPMDEDDDDDASGMDTFPDSNSQAAGHRSKVHRTRSHPLGSPRPDGPLVRRIASMSELKLGDALLSDVQKQPLNLDIPESSSSTSLFSSSAPISISSGLRIASSALAFDGPEPQATDPSSVYRPSPRPSPSSLPRRRASSANVGLGVDLFGSLLGSYEESILNGRMSTSPCAPIEFLAEIGVFGQGKCKSSLKCPPHALLPCPATYYLSPNDNIPSPYVGLIDLERGLASAEVPGLYRVPHKGMLQVIIKNPNKTVVKVFLVPYDLTDMPNGTKTFLRQKSYSQGPPHGLRYAVHLKFVCPGRRRLYLHQNIRVVFSHWMPDSSEKLRVTVTEAKPKFSPATPGSLGATDADDEDGDADDSQPPPHLHKGMSTRRTVAHTHHGSSRPAVTPTNEDSAVPTRPFELGPIRSTPMAAPTSSQHKTTVYMGFAGPQSLSSSGSSS